VQCRVFFLVLASLGSVHAQSRPPEISSPRPMVDIDTGPSLPIDARPSNDVREVRVPDRALVSVSNLGIPERARRELEKATQLLAKRNWAQARDRLNKAISLYPSYAGAYNDLGVVYAHLGDVDRERQSLEKAIAIDDHFALAQMNFGRMDIEQGNLPEAEVALNRATSLAPQDARAFILLSYCQFLQGRFDDAIATTNDVHKLSAAHAVAHRVAARAFEQKGQYDRAASELNLFLQEQSEGPVADAARKELQLVQAVQRK
jgi:tetratricopeptide (TPR) repeat protein